MVLAKNSVTVGIGAGQMSRVDSTRIAVIKSEDRASQLGDPNLGCHGAVAASDAFFPFPDGIFSLAAAGVSSVFNRGSLKDKEVICANKSGISMVYKCQTFQSLIKN